MRGVEVLVYRCDMSPGEIAITRRMRLAAGLSPT